MVMVKKGLLLFLFVAIISATGESRPVRVQHRNLGNVTYFIHDDGLRRISSKELMLFHQTFTQAARHVFHRYNERLPSTFKVSISTGSWIFQYQAGLDEDMTGLFHQQTRRFFFQNPAILREKKILEKIIYHEMMHCLIHRAQRGKEPHRLTWLEDCFCEALFPSLLTYSPVSAADFRAFKKFPDFKAWLRANLRAASPPVRQKARSLAATYGKMLLKMTSERRILGILIDGRGALVLEKAFLKLRE